MTRGHEYFSDVGKCLWNTAEEGDNNPVKKVVVNQLFVVVDQEILMITYGGLDVSTKSQGCRRCTSKDDTGTRRPQEDQVCKTRDEAEVKTKD